MRFQKCGPAVVLMLAVILLPFFISGFATAQVAPDQAKLMSMIKVEPSAEKALGKEFLERAKGTLAQQIAADFEAMKLLFEAKDFCCLAKLLGKRGATLVTPGFEKACGGGSAEFWQSVWKEGLELSFVPISIVVSGAITPQPVPLCRLIDEGGRIKDEKGNPILYNAVGFLIFEFHIVPKAKGATSHNATGEGSSTYLHKTSCPWG